MKKITADDELNHFLINAQGISRFRLNIHAALGTLFPIISWLALPFVYMRIGDYKKGTIFLGVLLTETITVLWTVFSFPNPIIARIVGFAYLGTCCSIWVTANLRLNKYRKIAQIRINEIESEKILSTNKALEKGLLLLKVFRKQKVAEELFKKTFEKQGGDSYLWNLYGIAFTNEKKYTEARKAFEKASRLPEDKDFAMEVVSKKKLAEKKGR